MNEHFRQDLQTQGMQRTDRTCRTNRIGWTDREDRADRRDRTPHIEGLDRFKIENNKFFIENFSFKDQIEMSLYVLKSEMNFRKS
jgi:hypothetical protein